MSPSMGEAYGTLVFTRKHQNEGRVMVTVKSEEDLSRFHIVPGAVLETWRFTDTTCNHLGVLRKVVFRVKSSLNFVFRDEH